MATDQQPKALRLADLCRSGALINDEWDEVAAELRRLHAVESGAKVELMRRDNLIDSLNGLCESYRTQVQGELEPYDAGLLNDFGGGNAEWWQGYIRAELEHAHDFYQSQITTPQPAQATPVCGAQNAESYPQAPLSLTAAPQEWSPAYTRGQTKQSAPVAAVPALVPLSVLQYNQIPELCQIRPSLYESVVRAIEAAIAKINGLTVGDGAHSGALHCKKCHADRAKEGCRNQYRDCPFTGNAQPIKDAP